MVALPFSPGACRQMLAQGASFMALGTDLSLLGAALRNSVGQLQGVKSSS